MEKNERVALSLDQVKAIQEKFVQEYLGELFGRYANSCGISYVNLTAKDTAYPPEEADDYCIFVGWHTMPPESAVLPDLPEKYQGVRVYAFFNGPIQAAQATEPEKDSD